MDTAGPFATCRPRARPPKKGLKVHGLSAGGAVVDESGHFQAVHGLNPGDRVLIRLDRYVAAIVARAEDGALLAYLQDVGALWPNAPAA